MNNLFTLFINNLLPVALAAGAGYLLARLTNLNIRPLSQVTFYIFSPCLIFTLITKNNLGNGDMMRTVGFVVVTILLVGALTWLAGKALKLERRTLVAVILSTMFMNAGNYGLSVVLFAFGETALSYASIFFVTNALLSYSVGVVIASMGTASFTQALTNLVKIPTLYALILAIVFLHTGWEIPMFLERSTTLLGDASIPAMLVLLGAQFKDIQWSGNVKPIALANIMRLLVAPVIALILASFVGLTGPARQAAVLESAMPTAVLTSVLATEFDAKPNIVSAIVFTTTLLSLVTLTPLMAFLGG